MHLLRIFAPLCALVSAAMLLHGCAGKDFDPPTGTIGGISAPKSKIIMSHQQKVIMAGNVDYVLPAGEYRPAVQDATGIYYEAPSKVIMKENFLGIHLPGRPYDGGIFLERGNPRAAKIYIVTPANEGGEIQRMLRGGRPAKPLTPREPIQFQLTQS